jgi:hypothetical protein
MILSVHAAAGGFFGAAFAHNPFLSFLLGFGSHFLLDAIPHWHYHLKSKRHGANPMEVYFVFDRSFLRDLCVTGIDCAIGTALIAAAVYAANAAALGAALAGAVGGVLPDALQLAYSIFPRSPLKHLQRFHHAVHASTDFDRKPFFGISAQLAGIALAVLLTLVQ